MKVLTTYPPLFLTSQSKAGIISSLLTTSLCFSPTLLLGLTVNNSNYLPPLLTKITTNFKIQSHLRTIFKDPDIKIIDLSRPFRFRKMAARQKNAPSAPHK